MSTNPANLAVFRSKTLALVGTLRLAPAEVVNLALRLAVEHADKAGIDATNLNTTLGDLLAAHAVEGSKGGGDAG